MRRIYKLTPRQHPEITIKSAPPTPGETSLACLSLWNWSCAHVFDGTSHWRCRDPARGRWRYVSNRALPEISDAVDLVRYTVLRQSVRSSVLRRSHCKVSDVYPVPYYNRLNSRVIVMQPGTLSLLRPLTNLNYSWSECNCEVIECDGLQLVRCWAGFHWYLRVVCLSELVGSAPVTDCPFFRGSASQCLGLIYQYRIVSISNHAVRFQCRCRCCREVARKNEIIGLAADCISFACSSSPTTR